MSHTDTSNFIQRLRFKALTLAVFLLSSTMMGHIQADPYLQIYQDMSSADILWLDNNVVFRLVPDIDGENRPEALTVGRWPDDDWFQVQNAVTFESLCKGVCTCVVPNGAISSSTTLAAYATKTSLSMTVIMDLQAVIPETTIRIDLIGEVSFIG